MDAITHNWFITDTAKFCSEIHEPHLFSMIFCVNEKMALNDSIDLRNSFPIQVVIAIAFVVICLALSSRSTPTYAVRSLHGQLLSELPLEMRK